MAKLNLFLVDDHKLFREGMKLLLSMQSFVNKIYEASSGREFFDNIAMVDADVVLMDIEIVCATLLIFFMSTQIGIRIYTEIRRQKKHLRNNA